MIVLQIDVGIRGVAPGYNTQQFLSQKMRQCKFWGGLALAGLAVTANLFDQLCLSIVGTTLATTSLVIIVGAVMQTSRQVRGSPKTWICSLQTASFYKGVVGRQQAAQQTASTGRTA
eukprot:GHUV01050206.1.p1 GENE.GHUV01050206.1~~GHUV01050206.1.p1  ORF type:complete len:117 (+),score=9.89 GHUV01050206.1:72-422(+)